MSDGVDLVPVRFATLADLPVIFGLLRAMHRETPHAPLVEDRMQGFVRQVLGQGAVVLTLAEGGQAVGTCGLLADAPWWSDQRWVRDVWLFVEPAHRRTPHARALLRAAVRYAAALRAPLVMEVAGGPAAGGARRVAAKVRLYRRELGEATGATWVVGG